MIEIKNLLNYKTKIKQEARRVCGVSFVVDITRSEKSSIMLENRKNGRVKNRLLDDIISKAKQIYTEAKAYKRSYSIVFFFELNSNKLLKMNEILDKFYFICVNVINKYNQQQNKEIFKGSYGADFSKANIIFSIKNKQEIFGKSVNLAYKLAMHEKNEQSFYIGQELTKFIDVNKNYNFNVIKGINYKGYKKNVSKNNNPRINYNIKPSKNVNLIYKTDGAIYFVIDLANSTKALFKFDIWDVFQKYVDSLLRIHFFLNSKYYKSEFRGDGFIFWKHGVFSKIKIISEALLIANKIENNDFFKKERIQTKNLKIYNTNIKNLLINRVIKLKIGIDTSKDYLYTNANSLSLSPHKAIAELCEKYATKEFGIVVGESFISLLYMNDKDYCKIVKEINGYKLKRIENEHFKKSGLNSENGFNWKHQIFQKYIKIDFTRYNSPNKNSQVKNYGKEARSENQTQIREGLKREDTKFNGLHFYITSNGAVLDVWINDGRGKYVRYE